MTNILHFFINLTAIDWLLYSFGCFLLNILCYYILSFWSHYFRNKITKWTNGETPNIEFIARNFLWPIYAPFLVVYTIGFFFAYRQYEYDEIRLKELEEEDRLLDEEEERKSKEIK